MFLSLSRRALALFIVISLLLAAIFCAFPWAMTRKAAAAAAPPRPAPARSSWDPIRRVFNQRGEAEGEYFRINLPRSDLRFAIGGDELSPHFEFTSYMGFMPDGARPGSGRIMAMGEVVLRDDEVPGAVAEAFHQGLEITALHNHLIGETPRIVYMHVMGQGTPEALARKIRTVFAATNTPLRPTPEERGRGDWSAIDGILGRHAETAGPVAEYVFPRRERLAVHGMTVRSTGLLETASEVVFQQLGQGRLACTGEMFVLPSEVHGVIGALGAHGFHITAVHNHMLDETPRMYWVHWYGTGGDGATMARGVAAAIARTNSARQSASEG